MNRALDSTILERLRADGPATDTELAAAVEAHPARVRRRCTALQRAGRLQRSTGGVYVVTDREVRRGRASD